MDWEEEARYQLKSSGLRRTAGRVRLLAFLLEAKRPLSHAAIVQGLGDPPADRVSVYRNLEAFAERGIVHRACVDDRIWLFETSDRCGETVCHPHFTCRVCARVQCLTGMAMNLPLQAPPKFRIERVQVHFQGVCPDCAEGSRKG